MGNNISTTLSNIFNNNPNSFIKISLDKEIYFPGDQVTGEVWIEPTMDVYYNQIVVSLIINENWEYFDPTYHRNISDSNEICLYKLNLIQNNSSYSNNQFSHQNMIMNANTRYQFPFAFTLNKHLISSFEYPKINSTAFAKYVLTADLFSHIPYPRGITDLIIKSRPKVLNEPLNYASCINVYTWGIIPYGTTIMSAYYSTNNYKYNDTIIITVAINNSRGELDTHSIEFKLIRNITFFNKSKVQQPKIKQYTKNEVIQTKTYPFECLKNTKMSQNLIIQLKDEKELVNYNENTYTVLGNNKGVLLSDINSFLIDCHYTIEITCDFISYVGNKSKPRIILPLSVTYQSIKDLEIQNSNMMREEEEIKKAIYESQIEFQNKIFQEEEMIREQEKQIANNMQMNANLNDNNNDYPLMENSISSYPHEQNNNSNQETKGNSQNSQNFVDINAL